MRIHPHPVLNPFVCYVRDITVSCRIDCTDKCVTGDDCLDYINKCVTDDDRVDYIDICVTIDDCVDHIYTCIAVDDWVDHIDKCMIGDDCVDFIGRCVTGDGSAARDVSEYHGEILPLQEVKHFKSDHFKCLIIGNHNVHSIRHKIYETTPLLQEQLVHILAVDKTKIDDSFPHSPFHVPNYKLYRHDRNSHGGNIMLYVNDNIPNSLLKGHSGEFEGIDFLTLEMTVKSYKWILVYIYRTPRVYKALFSRFLCDLCQKIITDDCIF